MRLKLILAALFLSLFLLLSFALFKGDPLEPMAIQIAPELTAQIPYHGHSPYILHFMGSWCHYCRFEYPLIRRLKAKTNMPMVAIAYKESKDDLQKWLNEMGSVFSLIIPDKRAQYAHQMGIFSIPQTLMVDKRGNVTRHIDHSLTRSIVEGIK